MLALPGVELSEIEPWYESGKEWRRLKVVFQNDLPIHSKEQIFYFESSGLLRRLDYTAEVVGSWAKAAHYCSAYKKYSGIMFPTIRRVYPRRDNGKARNLPILVSIDVEDVILT